MIVNFVYALMVKDLDPKQREEFDSTLNSGVSSSSWAQIEGRAFDRLQAGEFDRGTDLHQEDLHQEDRDGASW